ALSIWQGMGYQMIIFLGGLQAISPSLYEAAEIDNASGWGKFWNVTVPELKPISIYILLTITIGAFKLLVQPMVMTGGGPAFSTYSLVYYIYDTGTVNWDMGYSSAMAIVFAIIV
ncbi:carbohydrate ABC transporter permease, partial [Clostridium perfringens]